MSAARLYHVAVINDRTGAVTLLTGYPEPHAAACTILSKCTPPHQQPKGWARDRRYQLIEVVS